MEKKSLVIVVIGLIVIAGAAAWRSLPNGARVFIAFTGAAVVAAGAISTLALSSLRGQVANPHSADLKVVIQGTPGMPFRGNWAVATLGGSSAEGSLFGVVPRS